MALLVNESSMKITDLHFDCIERCLQHLSIAELLNVADANNGLRCIARQVFDRLYGENSLAFIDVLKYRNAEHCSCGRCYSNSYIDNFMLMPGTLVVQELKSSLRFLRCFGDLISKISFDFYDNGHASSESKHCQTHLNYTVQRSVAHEWENLIVEHINDFCHESLISLSFSDRYLQYANYDFSKLTKPFVNVEELVTNIFFRIPKEIHKLFPKVRSLIMRCSHLDFTDANFSLHSDFMANHFPYLERLWIDIDHRFKFKQESLAIALLLNPQIKTLKGNVWFDVLFKENHFYLWNGNENLKNLEELDLVVDPFGNAELIRETFSEDLRLKSLINLRIKFVSRLRFYVDLDIMWMFPLICEKLESLSISVAQSKLANFSNLLNKHPTVKTFNFQFKQMLERPVGLTVNDCSIISNAFPLLEEISFEMLPPIVGAIEIFPLLKCFNCSVFLEKRNIHVEFDRLVHSLNNWSLSKILCNRSNGTVKLVIDERREN